MNFATVFLASCVLVGLGVAAMAAGALLGRGGVRGGCGCGSPAGCGAAQEETCGECDHAGQAETACELHTHHQADPGRHE